MKTPSILTSLAGLPGQATILRWSTQIVRLTNVVPVKMWPPTKATASDCDVSALCGEEAQAAIPIAAIKPTMARVTIRPRRLACPLNMFQRTRNLCK